ncbi:MAG: MFS transporter, partial [Candidatus Latescibacteria bacterium]|nr:MFS transporter [Candidatus Latescibacterota bacterium]
AALPDLVKGPELLAANALSSATWGIMLTVGSAIGGGVAMVFGRDASFILNGVSFFISGLFVLRIVLPKTHATGSPTHFFSDFVAGIGYIKRDMLTRVFLPAKAVWGLGSGAAVMLYALFGGQVFDKGDAGIAILFTARGAGTLIGTLGMKFLPTPNLASLRKGIFIGLASYGLFFIVFSFSQSIWIGAACLMLSTCGSMVMWVFSSLGLQLVVDEDFRGRGFAADGGLFTLATAISTLAGGLFLDLFDPRVVAFGAGAIGIAAATLWFLLSRSVPMERKADSPLSAKTG